MLKSMEKHEQEQERLLWKSDSPETMVSLTVARAISSLLSTRTSKLHQSISRVSNPKPPPGSLEDSLWFINRYVKDAAERNEKLDDVLIPVIENCLRTKDTKHGTQAMIVINWLFQDEFVFEAVATNLADVILRTDDRYLALGWCVLVRVLVEYERFMDQYTLNGIRDNNNALITKLCSCLPHLARIVCKGSTLQAGFELPSRLSVAAADCILSITEALTRKTKVGSKPASLDPNASHQHITLLPTATGKTKVKQTCKSSEILNLGLVFLLWDQIGELIVLLQKLHAWSKKSRPLHAKGVEQVLKWLQQIKGQYGPPQVKTDENILKTGALLLSSCWKHYSVLLHLDDQNFSRHCSELLEQYISGIQYYTDNHAKGNTEDNGVETRKFFLNCLCLLLGRLDGKKFESILSEYGVQISRVLVSQLHFADEDVVAGAVCVFKAAIFRPNSSSGCTLADNRRIDTVLPMLLHLLDERDGTARAVVILIAEYCSMSIGSHCLKEVLIRLASTNALQRRNAIDVISELVCLSDSLNKLSHSAWQDIANSLLERLNDEEIAIHEQASYLLSVIDPSLVLPALVHLVCSSKGVHSSARDAFLGLLKYHNKKPEVICLLLDCLSNLSQCLDPSKPCEDLVEGQKVDMDRVFKLIPEWSKSVEDWNCLIGPLLDKMFAEPANATIVRFLSLISEQLAASANDVLYPVMLQMKEHKEALQWHFQYFALELRRPVFSLLKPGNIHSTGKSKQPKPSIINASRILLASICVCSAAIFSISACNHLPSKSRMNLTQASGTLVGFNEGFLSRWGQVAISSEDSVKMQQSLFERLCPLLIIRLLPLRIFDDLNSSIMYDQLANQAIAGCRDIIHIGCESIAAFLLNRAFSRNEFEDVRKLAAELCGRIHPQVLLPIVSSILLEATCQHDILRLKACVFSICTCLVVRGRDSISHPVLLEIRRMLEAVLLWPSLDGDEVSKAQHGCIDCLALMICAELQALQSSKESLKKLSNVGEAVNSGNFTPVDSVHVYVTNQLINDKRESVSSSVLDSEKCTFEAPNHHSFRLCMANVLISACQKIPETGRKPLARKVLPRLIHSVEALTHPEIRAACIQVLFSAVYHLKSAVLPYSTDLLNLSLKCLREGSEKERMGGAKLMGSLMASEDAILQNISGGLLEARSVLASISRSDPCMDVRKICKTLVSCITAS